jgi:hypothetical protein
MLYTHGKTIKSFASADGKRVVDIVARYDGCFQFFEHVEKTVDGETYWAPGWMSGIYLTVELAERDAIAELPWLKNQTPN